MTKKEIKEQFEKLPAPVQKTLDSWCNSFKKLSEKKRLTKDEKELICIQVAGGVETMLNIKHGDLGTFSVDCKHSSKAGFEIRTLCAKHKGRMTIKEQLHKAQCEVKDLKETLKGQIILLEWLSNDERKSVSEKAKKKLDEIKNKLKKGEQNEG